MVMRINHLKTNSLRLSIAIASGLFALGFAPGKSQAETAISGLKIASSSQALTSNETLPPIGWVQLCREYASDPRKPCTKQILPAVDVKLDTVAWKEMVRINSAVNAEIEPATDMDHWGTIDRWSFPDDKRGDCEDYVLEKRQRLMKAGFPRQALLITVVRDLEGDGHAILTVKTDKGDYVLDNMHSTVRPWTSTGYKFIKRQSQENPNTWVSLGSVDTAIYTSKN